MATIKQIGTGRKTIGTVDGIVYVTRKGVTYARATPIMPVAAYKTPAALKRQAIFKMVQMHMKYHLRTIKQTFTRKGNGTVINRFTHLNYKAFAAALDALADRMVAGEVVTLSDIEAAIAAYAAEHPQAILIAARSGYGKVYLTGAWPDTITLRASGGDSTIIVIVAENGQTTTITPAEGGSTTVISGGGSESGSGSGSDSGSGSGSSTGSETPTNPRLTINRSGSGTATVTAGGNAVNSGDALAEGTAVSLTITPAEGATPTATLGSQSVTLTESDGTYTGSFTMPSSNVTLTINTGGTSGGGVQGED